MNEVITDGLAYYYETFGNIVYYDSAAHIIPYEVVNMILDFVLEFHRADATERMRFFHREHGPLWQTIMSDVRMNCPKYSVFLALHSDLPIYVSIFSYDCSIERLAAIMPAAEIHSRALSIHREFLCGHMSSQPSIMG